MNTNLRNHRRIRTQGKLQGFTLMEVLLVLVILVILASLAVTTYSGVQSKALKQAAKTKVGLIAGQVDLYQLDMNSYPGGIQDLINKPSDARAADKWSGPYLKESNAITDPWDNEIRFAAPGKHNGSTFDVWSTGLDSQDGTADDIGNWENS